MEGNDNQLTDSDVMIAAAELGVTPAHVRAIWAVEAAGAGFENGLPKILFEPHRFSRATKHRFDFTNPKISYPTWNAAKYSRSQEGRYEQLLTAVGLDVDAGFASASYGAFQILGENFKVCGFRSPYAFAVHQGHSEADQLDCFIRFVKGNRLDDELRRNDWAGFARGYNGTAFAKNRYDVKLAEAFASAARA